MRLCAIVYKTNQHSTAYVWTDKKTGSLAIENTAKSKIIVIYLIKSTYNWFYYALIFS
jgi:ribosomal protein L18